MSQVSRSSFASTLATKVPSGTPGAVSAQDLRETFTDLEDSALWYDELPLASSVVALSAATPVLTDVAAFIDDPGGTPANAKMTLQVLMDLFEANMSVDLSSFTLTGTTAQFNTALSDGSFVTLAGTETLTNKTLTDPKITTTLNEQTGTTYTLVLTDASKVIHMSNASANTLTIPTNASVAFPIGTSITVIRMGAGVTTIAAASGVTLTGNGGSGDTFSADIQTRYNSATLYKYATNGWNIIGDIDTVAA